MTPVWVVGLLLFVVGACVGSFLNVVIYRLPRGKSLIHPASRCPACDHAIRWHDNSPIVGWLMLRGRCRDCQAPISARYPLVEALVGVLFVCLGSFTLARIADGDAEGSLWAAICAAPALWLLCVLLAAAFMEYDSMTPPTRMLLIAAIVGFLAFIFCAPSIPWPTEIWDKLVGALLGVGCGRLLRQGAKESTLELEFMLIGAVLGCLPLIVISLLAVLAHYLSFLILPVARRPQGWAVWLTAASFLWIMSAPWIVPFIEPPWDFGIPRR